MGEAPPWSAEADEEEPALDGLAEDFQGIFGGCSVRWTRASFEAARILVRAESNKGDGKIPGDEGRSA